MSDVRQRPEVVVRPAVTWRWPVAAGTAGLRALAAIGSVTLHAALAGALVVVAMAWRLGAGPLDVTELAQVLAAREGARIGTATLQWADPDRAGLVVMLTDAQAPADGPAVRSARIVLSVPNLVQGRPEPADIVLTGLRATLTRAADGTIVLPGGPPGGGAGPNLRTLRHIKFTDAELVLDDATWGPLIIAGDAQASREQAGVSGTAQARLTHGAATAEITARAAVTEDGTSVTIDAAPVELAPLLAGVSLVAGTGGRLGGTATLTLSPALDPLALSMDLSMGPGRFVLNGVPVPFVSAATALTAGWTGGDMRPTRIDVLRAAATVAAASGALTTADATAAITRAGDQVAAGGTLRLDQISLGDLSQFWPVAWGGHARPWIVENVTAGAARNGQARFAGTIGMDGRGLAITKLETSLQADEVTVSWLRPVPPIQHAVATLTMTSPDVIEIRVPSARQGTVPLQNSVIRITGLAAKDQNLSVVAEIANGSVPDMLTLLKHPRLNLLSAHPLPIVRPAGTARGRLEVTMPLEGDLQIEQIAIHASGQLSGLRLGGLVAGRDIDRGTIGFDVTQDGLRASGDAYVAGIPSKVAVEMDFRGGPPGRVVQTASVQGRTTPAGLAAAGLDAGAVLTGGSIGVSAQLTERDGQGSTIEVSADLRDAAMRLLGWRKAPGTPARARATLVVVRDRLVALRSLQADGPGLLLEGQAEMVGDLPSRLVLSRIELGPTRAAGVIDLPQNDGGRLSAKLVGPLLDVSNEIVTIGKDVDKASPMTLDLRFDTVVLANRQRFAGVSLLVDYDGSQLRQLRLQTQGPERLQAVIESRGTGRRVSVRMADGGAVLQALDVSKSLVGGALAVEAQYDDRNPTQPLTGTLDISEFHVRDAPGVGKLLQALSIYGLPEAMSGPGLKFSRLIAPFVWGGQMVYLGESQAFSASLGLTAKGTIDLRRGTLDVSGTVVPLYVINSALGRIPGIGQLFSPERGGGLFAVSFGLHGPATDPSVAVNPLSALTPGLARRLFRIFD